MGSRGSKKKTTTYDRNIKAAEREKERKSVNVNFGGKCTKRLSLLFCVLLLLL